MGVTRPDIKEEFMVAYHQVPITAQGGWLARDRQGSQQRGTCRDHGWRDHTNNGVRSNCIAHIQGVRGWISKLPNSWHNQYPPTTRLVSKKGQTITYKKWLSQCRWCFGMLIYLFTVVWGPVHNFCLSADTLSIIFLFYVGENYDDINLFDLVSTQGIMNWSSFF